MASGSSPDQETIARLKLELLQMQRAYARSSERARKLQSENVSLRMRLIRLRRLSGLRGVAA
ncbi:MAG: hypothetical protein ACRBBO_15360 [Cognatishimia sp.]